MKKIKKILAVSILSMAIFALPVNAAVSPTKAPTKTTTVTKTSPKTADLTMEIFGTGAAACAAVALVAAKKRRDA